MILNKLADIKKFFAQGDSKMSSSEFLDEWNKLSEEDKAWFKSQSLETE